MIGVAPLDKRIFFLKSLVIWLNFSLKLKNKWVSEIISKSVNKFNRNYQKYLIFKKRT